MILCVAGNPAVDKLFEVGRLEVGQIHRPESFLSLAGGKGVHVAQVVALFGGEPVLTCVLGGHAGRWLADQIAASDIEGRFAWTDVETRGSLSVADRSNGDLTEFYESGAPVPWQAWDEVHEIALDALSDAAWLAMAGSLPAGAPVDGYARLIESARAEGVSSAVDSRGAWLADALDAGPELVKINAGEAAELLGHPVEGEAQALGAARSIWSRAGGEGHTAIVTLSHGIALIDGDGAGWLASVPARGRYPVGCGDSFLGAMLFCLEAGQPDWESLKLALGAAAANAQTPGAALFSVSRAHELAGRAQRRRA